MRAFNMEHKDTGRFLFFFTVFTLCLILSALPAWAYDISDLLEAVAGQPAVELSELAVRESEVQVAEARSALYPKVNLFGRTESYNSPTNLRPMPPTEVDIAAGDSIPFSRDILRYGVTLEMPLYAKQLYTLQEKLKLLGDRAGLAHRINLISRQSAVLAANSSYLYLVNLDKAIAGRIDSLGITGQEVEMKVKNGRAAEIELYKINNSINELKQQRNSITARIADVRSDLKQLTGIDLAAPVAMELTGTMTGSDFITEQKIATEVAAAGKEAQRSREARYPVLLLYGAISGNDGEAYNTDEHIYRSYNYGGVKLQMPLFDRTIGSGEELADIRLNQARKKLAQARIELAALAENLREKLPLLDQSLQLAQESEKNSRELLATAKVSFTAGRMTMEEYLRYESQLLTAQAAVEEVQSQRWQLWSQQAVLYGIDLRGVVR
jgi:outer membrane protein TolC